MLIEDFKQPQDAIAIAIGTNDELGDVDLFAPDCPIRFNHHASQASRGLGLLLRLRAVLRRGTEVGDGGRTDSWPRAAPTQRHPQAPGGAEPRLCLRDDDKLSDSRRDAARWIGEQRFPKIEADSLVKADPDQFHGFEDGGSALVFDEPAPEGVDLAAFKSMAEAATGGRVTVDVSTGKITARGALSNIDRTTLELAMEGAGGGAAGRLWADTFVHKTRGARLGLRLNPVSRWASSFPVLTVSRNGRFELFDRVHFLDIPWALDTCDPSPIHSHFAPPSQPAEEAHVDVSTAGAVTMSFVRDLHAQLALELGSGI